MGAYFEAHIEQGPILEAEAKTIGVVTGAQGQRWFDLRVTGAESHAGTTPMDRRRDALLAAARLVDEINKIALERPPHAVTTAGCLKSSPESRNTIPGEVFLTVDLRHPEDAVLSEMAETLRARADAVCAAGGCGFELEETSYTPPIVFDDTCVAAVRAAADTGGYGQRRLPHEPGGAERHDLRALRRRHQPQRDRIGDAGGPDGRLQRAAERHAGRGAGVKRSDTDKCVAAKSIAESVLSLIYSAIG
jgi:hydantoinase/carbamoylase family amidase